MKIEDLNLDVLLHTANKMQSLYQFEVEQAIPKSKKRRVLKGQILVWKSIEMHLQELKERRGKDLAPALDKVMKAFDKI